MVACWLRWVLERSLGMLGHALCRGKEKCTFGLLSLEETALVAVRVICALAVERAMLCLVVRWGFFFHTSYFLIRKIVLPGGCTAYCWTLSEHCYVSLTFAFTLLDAISAVGIQVVHFLQHSRLVLCRNCLLCGTSCWIHQEWVCLSSEPLLWPYFHFSSVWTLNKLQ